MAPYWPWVTYFVTAAWTVSSKPAGPKLKFYTSSYLKYTPNKHIFAIWCLPPLHTWNLPAKGPVKDSRWLRLFRALWPRDAPHDAEWRQWFPQEVLCPPPSLAGGPGLQSPEGFTLWGTPLPPPSSHDERQPKWFSSHSPATLRSDHFPCTEILTHYNLLNGYLKLFSVD